MTEIRPPVKEESTPFGGEIFGPLLRGLRVGGQGVAEGLGLALGTPGATLASADRALRQTGRIAARVALGEEGGKTFADILSATPAGRLFDNISAGADRLFPEPEEIQRGFGNDLRSVGLGGAIIPETEMSPDERIAKEANAFGTLAALGSAGAFRTAAAHVGEKVPSAVRLMTDLLTGRGRQAAAAPLATKPLSPARVVTRMLSVRERKALERGTARRRLATDILGGAFGGATKEALMVLEDQRKEEEARGVTEEDRRKEVDMALKTLLGPLAAPLLTSANADGGTAPRGAGR